MIKKLRTVLFSRGSDTFIYIAVVFLALFGIVMIGDAGVGLAAKNGPTYATQSMLKQGVFVLLGLFLVKIVSKFFKNGTVKLNLIRVGYFGCLGLMFACLAFVSRNGSHAWIDLKVMTLQPSEFMKIALILFLAVSFGDLPALFKTTPRMSEATKNQITNKKFHNCFLIPVLAAGVAFVVCVGLQGDLGSAIVIALICVCIFLNSPYKYYSRWKLILIVTLIFVVAAVALGGYKVLAAHQQARFVVWKDPLSDPTGTSYQTVNGLIAFTKGGILGSGFGNSVMKYGYIPEAQTDFISAIIIEELGIVGLACIILPYSVIIFRLLSYSSKVSKASDQLILIGIASYFMIHLVVNLGGVSGLIPMTGVPLLLISAGGSSTFAALIAIGISQGIIMKYNKEKLEKQIQ